MEPKYLGRPLHEPIDDLDVIPARDGLGLVTLLSDELTCIGPVNEQPDYYKVRIEYVPYKLCIETKSLKLYLMHFRNQQSFCEDLVVIIRNKIIEVVQPKYCKVTLTQNMRGGIIIEANSEYGTR